MSTFPPLIIFSLHWYIHGVPYKVQFKQSHSVIQKWIRSYTPNLLDTQVSVSLVARPILSPVMQKLSGYKHNVFMSRACVYSWTLLCIRIVCCCLWNISNAYPNKWVPNNVHWHNKILGYGKYDGQQFWQLIHSTKLKKD